jgi:hypothetical protein
MYFNHKLKNLSHEQLKFHVYKILLKHEISDLVSLKSSNIKIFVQTIPSRFSKANIFDRRKFVPC